MCFTGKTSERSRSKLGNDGLENADEESIVRETTVVNRNFPPPVIEYSKTSMFLKHVWTLTIKRFHHTKRNKKGFIFEVILVL